MLTEIYIEALLVDEVPVDQVEAMLGANLISCADAALAGRLIAVRSGH